MDPFFVAPVPGENLDGLRAVVVLTETDVPEVIDRWFHLDHYRITGIRRAVREALIVSLGAAFESLSFSGEVPEVEYDVLLQPRIDLEKLGWFMNAWRIRTTIVASDRSGNLITEATALGEHGYFFLPDSGSAFRFALRKACQDSIARVAAALKIHFADVEKR